MNACYGIAAMLVPHPEAAGRERRQMVDLTHSIAGYTACQFDRQVHGTEIEFAQVRRPVADLKPTELLARKLSIAAESGQIDSVLKAVRWDVACENGRWSVSGRSRCQPMQHPASC